MLPPNIVNKSIGLEEYLNKLSAFWDGRLVTRNLQFLEQFSPRSHVHRLSRVIVLQVPTAIGRIDVGQRHLEDLIIDHHPHGSVVGHHRLEATGADVAAKLGVLEQSDAQERLVRLKR